MGPHIQTELLQQNRENHELTEDQRDIVELQTEHFVRGKLNMECQTNKVIKTISTVEDINEFRRDTEIDKTFTNEAGTQTDPGISESTQTDDTSGNNAKTSQCDV